MLKCIICITQLSHIENYQKYKVTKGKNMTTIQQKEPTPKNLHTVLIVTEENDPKTLQIAILVIKKLAGSSLFEIYSEDPEKMSGTKSINGGQPKKRIKNLHLDYIVCIGENSTLLRSLRFNKDSGNASILSISNGNEPIMTSYSICDMNEVLDKFVKVVRKNQVKVQKMMKMQVFENSNNQTKTFLTNFSSDLEIHRDMKLSVLKLKIYLRTEGKEFYELTTLWGDGLIISTPFGSMGRSMAQNGPLLHQNIECIELMAVCPLSLKFRPIILPKDSEILIKVSEDSRSPGEIFADGDFMQALKPGQSIKIRRDPKSTQLVKNLSSVSDEVAWIFKLQQVLSWGEHYSSQKKTKNSKTKCTNVLEKQQQIIEEEQEQRNSKGN